MICAIANNSKLRGSVRVVTITNWTDMQTLVATGKYTLAKASQEVAALRGKWKKALATSPRTLLVTAAPDDQGVVQLDLDDWMVPATVNAPNVLTVGGTTSCQAGLPANMYATGLGVDIMAPADGITVAGPNGPWNGARGTCMAVPQVASLAAILRSLNPSLTGAQLKTAILNSSSLTAEGKTRLNLLYPVGDEMVAQRNTDINRILDPPGSGVMWEVGSVLANSCDQGIKYGIGGYKVVRHDE
jgi:subtilisin family serine protease